MFIPFSRINVNDGRTLIVSFSNNKILKYLKFLDRKRVLAQIDKSFSTHITL